MQPKGRRTSIEIIADILRFLRLGETGKTEITCTVRLNNTQSSEYLGWLVEQDLLESAATDIGLPSYRITPKGLALLSKIESIREMLPPGDALNILHRSKVMEIEVPDTEIEIIKSPDKQES